MKRAADLLVETLTLHGVDKVFCVSGESYLSVLVSLSVQSDIEIQDAARLPELIATAFHAACSGTPHRQREMG